VSTDGLNTFKHIFNKNKQHTEMKLTPMEGEIQAIIVACGRSDVIPMMATSSAKK
jgi:hypothetical protein